MSAKDEIKSIIKALKKERKFKNQAEVAEFLGYNPSYFSRVMGQEILPYDFESNFFKNFPKSEYLDGYKKENAQMKKELKPKIYNGQTPVKVVSTNAQAGWSDAYYSCEYLDEMPTILIESDENYKGNYLAFEVKGESMEPDYYEGDIVICREVQRHLWTSKLHYNDYDFVIAHGTQGIMIKEIVNHNLENGDIMCHSLHPNHEDFRLNLREIAYLYNVVEVRQKGRNKRRNR